MLPTLMRQEVLGEIIEELPRLEVNCMFPGMVLPSAYRHVDVIWIEFDANASAARVLGRDQRRSRADHRVEHKIAGLRAVEEDLGYQGDRFRCRVNATIDAYRRRIIPYIRSTRLHILQVRPLSRFEY